MRLSSATARYLEARRIDTARLTRRKATYVLYAFTDWCGAEMAVRAVKRKHIEGWLLWLLGRVAPNTARTDLSIVRVFFSWCADHELVRLNPCAGIRPPRVAERVPREIPDAVPALLDACADARQRVIVSLMAREGLRRGEVAALMLEEIDLHQRVMLVHGKGSKDRWLPISEQTRDAIGAYLGEHPAASGPLVRSYHHPAQALGVEQISRLTAALMYAVGIKERPHDGKSPHALRHTFAGQMLDNGADPRDVQNAMGHRHLSTLSVYTRRRADPLKIRPYLPSYDRLPTP